MARAGLGLSINEAISGKLRQHHEER